MLTLAVVAGSCLYALMFQHRLGSPVFLRQLPGGTGIAQRLLRMMETAPPRLKVERGGA